MLTRVISGGQTGVDQAALRAAKAVGIPTGGYAPKGWLTEDGAAPWLADYGLVQMDTDNYPARTRMNVAVSRACLWVGDETTPGGKLTVRLCRESRLPIYYATFPQESDPAAIDEWLLRFVGAGPLMIAGNRESKSPGIGVKTEAMLTGLFTRLASVSQPHPGHPAGVTRRPGYTHERFCP